MRDDHTERIAAEKLGQAAARGKITRGQFTDALKELTPELAVVALAAYAYPRQLPGGPAPEKRTANLWAHRPGKKLAHRPSSEWRTDWPKA